MAHEITATDYMASYRETPWHEIGTVFTEPAANGAAMCRISKLDWEVELIPLIAGDENATIMELRTVRRCDTGTVFRKASVGTGTVPLQNIEALQWFDPWIANGAAVFETAGSLRGGAIVWALARWTGGLESYDIGGGDRVQPYVIITHAHDGSLAIYAGLTFIRVVCRNTLGMALGAAMNGGQAPRGIVRISHTSGAKRMLADVAQAIEDTNANIESMVARYRQLAGKKMGGSSWIRAFVDAVFGRPKTTDPKEFANPRVAKKVEELLNTGAGADMTSAKGTMWGLYNAVTEYITHFQGKVENRAAGLLPGQDKDKMVSRAFTVAEVMGGITLDHVFEPAKLHEVLEDAVMQRIAADGAALPASAIA